MGITTATARKLDDDLAGHAPRDHNRPPLEELIPLEFREKLLGDRPDFLKLMDDYLGEGDQNSEAFKSGAVHRAKCETDDDLGKCGRLVNALRAMEKHVNETHVAVKAPYLQGSRLVDAEKNALQGRITVGRSRVQGLMDSYAAEQLQKRREEQARLAEERRKLEELARENNIAPEALPPVEAAPVRAEPIRTDGATVSFGTEWDCVIEDYAKAFKKVKDDAKVREAIDAAIKRIVKATKGQVAIPGVRAFERAKTSAR